MADILQLSYLLMKARTMNRDERQKEVFESSPGGDQ